MIILFLYIYNKTKFIFYFKKHLLTLFNTNTVAKNNRLFFFFVKPRCVDFRFYGS